MRKQSQFSLKRGGIIRDKSGKVHRAASSVAAVVQDKAIQMMQNPLLTGALGRVGSFKIPMSTEDARLSQQFYGPSYKTVEGVWA